MRHTTALTVRVSDSGGDVEALLLRPDDARWLLVFAHGAGAGMHHPFMESLARELAACRVASLRYQFPYMQQRRNRPDAPALLTATVRAAVTAASEAASDLPLLAGGKSLGGRMTSLAFAEERAATNADTARVRGLVFFGFPLHPPGRPGTNAPNIWHGCRCRCCSTRHARYLGRSRPDSPPLREACTSCHIICSGHR